MDRHALNSSLTFAYRHANAPPWFSESLVLGLVAKAAESWSRCGVQARVLPWRDDLRGTPGLVLVQWSEAESSGNFGLANFGRATLSLGPKPFELLRSRNPSYDASKTLQMVIAHEMGHLFGLMAHSRRCVDVLSYYHNGKGEQCVTRDGSSRAGITEYRSMLPTACDIERCRRANGTAGTVGLPR